jgi:hypothetical protein
VSCVPRSSVAYCVVGAAHAVYYLDLQGSTSTWSTAQPLPVNGDSILGFGCAPNICVATGVQNQTWVGAP